MFNPDGSSCYGQSPDTRAGSRTTRSQTDFAAGTGKYDTPTIPAVGHPAFGNLIPGGSAEFLAPTAGVIRALDLGVNEYQGGQDFVVRLRDHAPASSSPGWPSPVNDLSSSRARRSAT